MTDAQAKYAAKTIEELYLYPYRSKEENLIRGGVWMASWIVGIVVQSTANHQALGGAYFIYTLSLLLEFVPERRKRPWAIAIHGLFCIILFVMMLGALVISFGNSTNENSIYIISTTILPCAGWIIFFMMFFGILLVSLEGHKYLYNEEAEIAQEIETQKENVRKRFIEHLSGTPKGGNS